MDESFLDVKDLACIEGKRLKPIRSVEDLNPLLPNFTISREFSKYTVHAGNFEHHPNADRMQMLAYYLLHNVCPNIIGDVSGLFQIELHDVYDPPKTDFSNTLVWSKYKTDQHVILLPDLYHMCDYFGKLNVNLSDDKPYSQKKDKVCFFGSSTGSTIIPLNERVTGCTWGSHNFDIADFFITRKVQMLDSTIIARNIMTSEVPLSKIFDYKFCCDIKGNTNCWDRVPIIMASNSLLLRMPCEFMSFYEPLVPRQVLVEGYEDLRKKRSFYLENQMHATEIVNSNQTFAKRYFTEKVARGYMLALFQEYVDSNQ